MIARHRRISKIATLAACAAALAGCHAKGQLVIDEGVGVTALRGVCPAVGIPDYTGDITLFNGAARTADAIDVVAVMTNVRSNCDDSGDRVYATASFDVLARRSNTNGARTVQIPYFSTVLRGGSAVVSKRVGTVTIQFADGQERAQASGVAGAYIDRAEATLPQDIVDKIGRKRRAGEEDAAIDPLTLPEVRDALARANFELLVGFQLSEAQLAYNATR
ncbi:hypothetical protein SZ64_17060 [Erythrobacter sp. SG61-1L]|uniref:hypothetical protein n=1 Tax=Erythrobacter sp. SG61-1L TaxID=1603897 RepID=UPI0006C8FF58|nr:hypothetical protein [Erythrobacter sp. SG61-1L]KPL69655.1 hypothetical protein SZ64_17060 [Erythrobacter sp. SG61-1L]